MTHRNNAENDSLAESAKVRASSLEFRRACIEAVLQHIDAHGTSELSLREVARRLGVSHQAPYKHFANREDLLAAVMLACFQQFTEQVFQPSATGAPLDQLRRVGESYLRFAQQYPHRYKLMFEQQLPSPVRYPELAMHIERPVHILRSIVAKALPRVSASSLDACALFVWSAVHGYASLFSGDAVRAAHPHLDREAQDENLFRLIGTAVAKAELA